MPEEVELDIREQQEKLEELHKEHEEHAKEPHGPGWARLISLSTAVLAVVAAIASLHSGSLVNEALLEQIKGTQIQAKASDGWAYYQAKALKQNGAEQTAAILAANPAQAKVTEHYREEAKRYGEEKEKQKSDAEKLEEQRDKANENSEHYMHKHHIFAICVTLTQIAIALSAIAALTRRKDIWYGSLAVGLAGIVTMIYGYMQH